jgi:sulfur carrier protein
MNLSETTMGTAGAAGTTPGNAVPPMTPISVRLNGDERTVPVGPVDALLRHLEIDPRTVVVELNRSIVRRAAFESTYIKEGDEIELVHFVGGG